MTFQKGETNSSAPAPAKNPGGLEKMGHQSFGGHVCPLSLRSLPSRRVGEAISALQTCKPSGNYSKGADEMKALRFFSITYNRNILTFGPGRLAGHLDGVPG